MQTLPRGLTTKEAKKRLAEYGFNEIVSKPRRSLAIYFFLRFKNPLIFILIFAATIAAFLGDWSSSLIIIVIVIASVILDFVNTYKSEHAAEQLKKQVMITATVIRDNSIKEISLAFIVPGDVVMLSAGDLIPADGEVLSAKDFFVNEASLSGESFPAEKTPEQTVFLGTNVVTGTAAMTVTATGGKTKFSSIAASVTAPDQPTEFDRSIKNFSFLIMKITFLLVIFIFLVNTLLKHNILESFLFATALSVGLTPELLPMIIALNLSKGSLSMSRHGVIVKKLSAIQNFGSMDILCTDKTGTLTEDRIVLMEYIDGFGKKSEEVFLYGYINSVHSSGLHNPLDEAVKKYKSLDIRDYRKIDEIPFSSLRRRNSIVVEKDSELTLVTKGAPEDIIKICRWYSPDETLNKKQAAAFIKEYHRFSSAGYRVLAVATRKIAERKEIYRTIEEKDLTFRGFIAFLDPPKKTVSETLRILEKHGVEIKILTGDNELVTEKIATEINLPVRGVLTGIELEKLTDEELKFKAESATIFSRVSPDQKKRLIEALQERGHVVGYLGDGLNDAPSLKAADVGISVNNAVDAAKDSADLILLHKSLRELVDGVIQGRKTFANTLKYLMMDLSSNFGNMFSMAAASLFLPFLPMLPVQILLNNLIYGVSQFAIPLDEVDARYVERPRRLNINFIKKFMVVFGSLSSVFDFFTFGVLLFIFHLSGNSFQTGWFLESIATQTLVIHVIRTARLPFWQSRPARVLLFSTIGAAIVGWSIALSKLGQYFKFTPLPLWVIMVIAGIVVSYLITVELAKRIFYKKIFSAIES